MEINGNHRNQEIKKSVCSPLGNGNTITKSTIFFSEGNVTTKSTIFLREGNATTKSTNFSGKRMGIENSPSCRTPMNRYVILVVRSDGNFWQLLVYLT